MTESPAATTVRPVGVEQRPTGWWGMVLTAMVIATTYAAMYFTVVYIRVSNERWPPQGVAPPALDLAALSMLALASSAVAVWLSVRWMRYDPPAATRGALAAGLLLGAGHVALLVVDWTRAGFGPADHAYGSVFWLLHGTDLLLVSAAVVGSGTILAQQALGAHDTDTNDEIEVWSLYWWFVVAASIALSVTATAVPYL